ncbi:triose-phosphate isomerase [Streptomyces nitrosporeus]|uniref:triose-phosphate isomerase n=1 Tax=Streptomyces nitrosporeus TaxID=28894 RepID=UPI0039A3DFCA
MSATRTPAGFRTRTLSCTNTKSLLDHTNFSHWAAGMRDSATDLATVGFVVLLPAQLLDRGAHAFEGTGIGWGAQSVWPGTSPPTGEIAAEALSHAGCQYVMCGHPERRSALGEDDATVAAAAEATAAHAMIPIVCVGERERTTTREAVRTTAAQAGVVLDALPADAPLVWLYEPPWTSAVHRAAPPGQVAAVCASLRELSGGRTARLRVLYGGAVAPGVLPALTEEGRGPDGLGVGRAAYDPEQRKGVIADLLALAAEGGGAP